ncbi:hypothetical protein J9303_04350 [Bacillaceae bacterium Marseille-Q3522]|nr:hypothetical protein [Bacillaceae bacterium Marseille-Q3522]
MVKLIRSLILTVVMFILAALAFSPFVNGFFELAEASRKEPFEGFEITIPLNYLFLYILLGIILTILFLFKRKKWKLSFWLYPLEVPEDDEREKAISAKACQKAFFSIFYIVPACMGLVVFYPVFTEIWPSYPVFVVILIPIVQLFIYFLYARKIFQS